VQALACVIGFTACSGPGAGSGGSGGGGAGGAGGTGGSAGVDAGVDAGWTGNGQLHLTWSLQDQATGNALGCRTGETVRLTTGGFVDVFRCSDMTGVTGLIPAGDYNVYIDLVDAMNTIESTVSMPNVPLRDQLVTDVGHILFLVSGSAGRVTFSWEIRVGNPTGAVGTCAANEAVGFDFGIRGTAVPCAPMSTTFSVPSGSYAVTASLREGMTVESQSMPINLTVMPNMTTDGGHIIFVVAMTRQK